MAAPMTTRELFLEAMLPDNFQNLTTMMSFGVSSDLNTRVLLGGAWTRKNALDLAVRSRKSIAVLFRDGDGFRVGGFLSRYELWQALHDGWDIVAAAFPVLTEDEVWIRSKK